MVPCSTVRIRIGHWQLRPQTKPFYSPPPPPPLTAWTRPIEHVCTIFLSSSALGNLYRHPQPRVGGRVEMGRAIFRFGHSRTGATRYMFPIHLFGRSSPPRPLVLSCPFHIPSPATANPFPSRTERRPLRISTSSGSVPRS